MNSPMYDYAGSETNVLLDGSIPSQDTQAGEALAQDLPVFVSDVDTQESLPDLFNANAKQMQAVALAGTLPNLYVGMHTGVANKINQSINEGIITKYALNGVAPVDAIQQELQTQEDLAKTTDEAVKNLSKADAELKAEQDKAKQIEQLILGAKYVAPSDQAYIQSIDQLAEMQKNAPVAPALEQPELTTTDQALIFLAGLIGGNQQVPQAVQGAVAGAQQRAALANQMKTQRFNQEQQNYNRQLQAQQTIVGKEAQVFNQAQQIAAQNYRTEYNNLVRRKAEQADVIKNAETRLDKKQTDALRRLRSSYEFMTKNQDKYTKDNAEAIAKARAYAISNLGLSEAEASVAFPAIQEGQLTLKGEVMKRRQVNDEARLRLAQTNQSLAGIKEATSRVENYLKTITRDGILTQVEATAVNAQFDEEAKRLGVPRSLFPVIDPFTTLQKQTADQVESNRAFMRNIASSRLSLAFTRASTMSEKQPKIDGFTLEQLQKKESELNNKLQGYASAKTTIQMQYGGKQSAEYDRAIIGLEVAEAKDKGERDAIQMQIAKRTGVKPPAITQMYNDLTAIGNMFTGMAPEQKAELERIKKTYGQQAPAKVSTPMLPPANTSTNPTPNPVPNPTPKPQPTPKPTTSTPKVGDKKVSPKGRTAEVVK
jgi:hypothetical protein